MSANDPKRTKEWRHHLAGNGETGSSHVGSFLDPREIIAATLLE